MAQLKKSSRRATSNPRSQVPISPSQYRFLGGALLIATLSFAAFWPALRGGFVLDDDQLLTDSPLIKASDGLRRIWCTTEPLDYWPLTNTSFWFEWRMWGMNPTGYHVTNVVLHVVNSLLVWLLLRRLSIPGAFLAGLLFAIHPVNVESVAWIAQRKNVLSMVFFLLSVLWFLKSGGVTQPVASRTSANQFPISPWNCWYWLSLLAFTLAMLSKGSVAVLPLLLLVIIWWISDHITASDIWQTVPFFIIAVTLTFLNIWFQTHGSVEVLRSATLSQRLLGAGAVVWFYLYKALLPLDLAFIYPQWNIQPSNLLWWLPLLSVLAVTAFLIFVGYKSPKNWHRGLFFAWVVFSVSLFPVMGFADVGFMKHSLVADHYQYIAIIPVLAIVAATATYLSSRSLTPGRLVIAAAEAAIIIGLLSLSRAQSRLYANSIELYNAALQKNPDSWLIHTNLSIDLNDSGNLADAAAHAQEAIRLKPDYPEAQLAYGIALQNQRKLAEAVDQYHQALKLNPKLAEAYSNLGVICEMKGQLPQAIEHLEHAIQLKPYFFEAQCELGRALAESGRLPESLLHFQEAVRIKSDSPEANFFVARNLAELNRPDEAVHAIRRAIELAQAQGQIQMAQKFAAWLTDVRSRANHQASPSDSDAPLRQP